MPKRGRPPGSSRKRDNEQLGEGGVGKCKDEQDAQVLKRMKEDRSMPNDQMQRSRRPARRPPTPVPSPPSSMAQRPSNAMIANAKTTNLFSPSTITGNVNNVNVFTPPQLTPLASGPSASSQETPTRVGIGPALLSFSLRADSERMIGLMGLNITRASEMAVLNRLSLAQISTRESRRHL
jgi:hypothetical protein